MSLFDKIVKLRPSLTIADFALGGSISLRNDSNGKGDYIEKWEHPTVERPSDEELQSA